VNHRDPPPAQGKPGLMGVQVVCDLLFMVASVVGRQGTQSRRLF
jgi:hypothetical protein